MEEPSRIVPSVRDRKPGEALTVIPAPSVLPWDQVPREPHLLDYLIILRKHQWLILTFPADGRDSRHHCFFQDETGV